MSWHDQLMLDMLEQGIDVSAPGLAYARRAYPDLDATEPARAYSDGFLDGFRAFMALMPLLHEGPNYDPAEAWRRLYDPDVLPVGK